MKRFIGQRWGIVSAVVFSLIIFSLNAAWSGGLARKGGLAPQDVVLKYYQALQKRDFSGAYQCISREMRDDKNQKQWVETMKAIFEGGEVVITEISVTPGPVSGQKAQVNTVINSRDSFNKYGSIEYNVEHLVLEDGLWKVDRTELKDSKIIGIIEP